MSLRCMYPGCAEHKDSGYSFCTKHNIMAQLDTVVNLLRLTALTASDDYRKVTNSALRQVQRDYTIRAVDEIKAALGSIRTNPYKSIR